MTRKKWFLCAGGFLSVSLFATYAWTQQTQGNVSVDVGQRLSVPVVAEPPTPANVFFQVDQNLTPSSRGGMRPRVVGKTVNVVVYEPIAAEDLEDQKKCQEATQLLKDSKDEEVRKKESETIHAYLIKQFERDLISREKELASVEERLKSLRQQLEKRKASKDEIVNLRFKTIMNNVEGLGFPGDEGLQEGASNDPLIQNFGSEFASPVVRAPTATSVRIQKK